MHGRNAAMIRRYFPTYRAPKKFYEAVLDECVETESVWLDLGCGRRLCADETLNAELPRRARLVVGCDRDPHLERHSSIRNLVLCDAAALPFRDQSLSLVTASMVVEHLEDPGCAFAEVARALKPGGTLVVFTPNRFNYAMLVAAATPHRFHVFWRRSMNYLARGEWRSFEDDVFPTWYRANSRRALRQELRRAGFVEKRLQSLSLPHSFGFVRPLYMISLLFERFIARLRLDALKADLLGVFVRAEQRTDTEHEVLMERGSG